MSSTRFRRRDGRLKASVSRTNLQLSSVKEGVKTDIVFRSASESSSLPSTRSSDNFLDPAQLELVKAEEAKRKRQSDETLIALEKIQSRISYTLEGYEGRSQDLDINLEAIKDSDHLYNLLSDPKAKSKYQQKLTVFIVGYEEKCENLERVLGQLQEFFEKTQAGGTKDLLEEVEVEEIDLDKATVELADALNTAKNAVGKLVNIKKELMSIVASYPDASKGRTEMEKALMKTQEEVTTFSRNLDEVQINLQRSNKKSSQLQAQLDAKIQECAELQKTADQVKLLQVGNGVLKKDLNTEKALEETCEELSNTKRALLEKPPAQLEISSDADKSRMEAQLEEERARHQNLVEEMKSITETHKIEIEALKEKHAAENKERFKEQPRSLKEDDLFGDKKELEDTEEHGDSVVTGDESDPGADNSASHLAEKLVEEDHTPSIEVGKLRIEYEAKEKKLLIQMEEIKAKSREVITTLQSQFSDSESKHMSEKDKLKDEFSDLNNRFTETQKLNDELNKKLGSLEDEKAVLVQRREEELIPNALKRGNISPHQQSNSSIIQAQSPMQSLSTIPVASSPVMASGLLASSERSNIDPSSLEQSVTSLDPRSPLQSSSLLSDGEANSNFQQGVPDPGLSMHHSPVAQNGTVNHKHPIVIEWGKAYDGFLKFRENLISMLSEHKAIIPQLSSSIEELKSMELHPMDKKQDPQGQITEMRFSLSLLLHQIEQTLEDSFMLFASDLQDQADAGGAMDDTTELRETLVLLTERLKHLREGYETVIENNKDTITQLSNKLESLKMEITKLQKANASKTKEGMIMFTRLDSERNTKALETALEKEKISPATFAELTGSMEEYLMIPGQRLAALTQRCQERTTVDKLLLDVYKDYSNSVQASTLVQGISRIEQRRQKNFNADMNQLGTTRNELAHSITRDLANIEHHTQIFLIKPILGANANQSNDLITSVPRSFPVSRQYYVADGDKLREVLTRPQTCHGSTPHSNVKTIQSFLKSQQRQPIDPQELINTLNAAYSSSKSSPASPTIKSSRQRALSSHHHHHHHHHHRRSSPPSTPYGITDSDWNVRRSQAWKKELPTAHPQPSFSKLMELDITRHRQPESLLGHMLPNLHQNAHNYTSNVHHHHHRPSMPSPKLISLPEESFSASNSLIKDTILPTVVPSK